MASKQKTNTPENARAAQLRDQELAAAQSRQEELQAEKIAKQRGLMGRTQGRLSLFSGSELGVGDQSKNTALGS